MHRLRFRTTRPVAHQGQTPQARADPYSPTFPGFYLYYASRHDQPSKLKAFIEYARRVAS